MPPVLEFALAATAIVVVPVALYLLAGWAITRSRKECPQCGTKKLRCVQLIRATLMVDDKRTPDFWSYHECEACHSRWKMHRGKFSTVSDNEWQENCERSDFNL
jgi:hypothetical protein